MGRRRKARPSGGKKTGDIAPGTPPKAGVLPLARFMASGGIEDVARRILSDYILRHHELMEELAGDSGLSCAERVSLLASLARSFNTTVAASRRVLPETGDLAVALEVLNLFAAYVRDRSPEALAAFADLLDPFGQELARHFQEKSVR